MIERRIIFVWGVILSDSCDWEENRMCLGRDIVRFMSLRGESYVSGGVILSDICD